MTIGSILIVDDEVDLVTGLARTLSTTLSCQIHTAHDAVSAISIFQSKPVDLILTDINMPGRDGMSLISEVMKMDAMVTVIVMTGYGTVETAVQAMKYGAYDFIEKPFDEDALARSIVKGLERSRLLRENKRLTTLVCDQHPARTLLGNTLPIQKARETIHMLSQTDVTVLITGETGTGKDLAAQAIHMSSARSHRPMVTVNCPAVPEHILESELFGYKKGAFTDARSDKKGLFDQGDGSTVFLDEIGDLSIPVQTKLLRVLQDKSIMPLGASKSHHVDVRIIAATNRDLKAKIKAGEFRDDLYYRLKVAGLEMPSLSQMRADIPVLSEHFLTRASCEMNMPPKQLSPETLHYVSSRPWPGNVRELENTIRGWCALTKGHTIHAPETESHPVDRQKTPAAIPSAPPKPYKIVKEEALTRFTTGYLKHLLTHTCGNVTTAAGISGIPRQSLQKIIKKYNISVESFRSK